MKFCFRGFRPNTIYTVSLLLAGACLSTPATAQPIPDFLTRVGGQSLSESNLGQSALAIQRTCGGLITLGFNVGGTTGTTEGHELWRRCNELVATASDLNPSGPPLPRVLGYSDDDELLAAFQQVNGEEVMSTGNLAQNASYEQFSVIASRLAALKGASSTSVASVSPYGADFMYGSGGGAAADDAGHPFGPWGWFFRGTITSGERDPTDATAFTGQENGFDYDQWGLTFGIDRVSGSSVWGFSVSHSSYEVEMTDRAGAAGTQTNVVSGGTIEADSTNAAFFFNFDAQNNVYFSALAGYGNQSFDMLRNFIYFSTNTDPALQVDDQSRLMTASPDGDSLSASLTVGRTFVRGSTVIDPRIGLTYDSVTIEGFSEVDTGNMGVNPNAMQLAFDEQEIDSLRATLGIQISRNVNTRFGAIQPTLSADWYHEFEDDPRIVRAKYALEDSLVSDPNPNNPFRTGFGFGNCASCFDLQSEAPDSDYFVIGAGIAAVYPTGIQAFAMVEALLGYQNLDAMSLTLGLRGQF